ncbi:Kelch repeat-containing protein [Flavobacterium collinsii]|uniref:N-acetylneuraminate epimerase n=1 Tax=Flavobacterium collinsii TaxID=1114861 RepID=A0ABN7EHH1_9FLAO|nr:kelch repeat-containing protein [Flavobacterium collinsii]CAA9197171.1 N-acetylneuraminate epimerase [Flavobacterium collinsii]
MNNFKKGIVFAALFSSLFFIGCSNDSDEDLIGNWIKKSAFDGPARSSATSFVIGDYAYVTTGYTGDVYLKDLWSYNSTGDYWEQKADFPGIGRSSASAFALNQKGYIGLGYDGTNKLKDFYQYNPTNNTWTQKTDFAGTGRYAAVGFQAGGKAYFGTGYDGNYLKDFYQYNDQTNAWTLVNGFSGNKRRNATAFVIADKVYLGTGSNNGVYQEDFWEFNPATDVWTRKRDIDKDTDDDNSYNDDYAIVRSNASSFTMNGLGYVVGGENIKTIWEYNPTTDLWAEKTPMEGASRTDAVGFAINNRGFYMLGRTGSTYFDDAWEFKPLEEQTSDDN